MEGGNDRSKKIRSQPEASGNVNILFLLLNHQTTLSSEGDYQGKDREVCHVGVEVVQPELVHRQKGSRSSHSRATMYQDCSWGKTKEDGFVSPPGLSLLGQFCKL